MAKAGVHGVLVCYVHMYELYVCMYVCIRSFLKFRNYIWEWLVLAGVCLLL